jgi:hypothetical protein
MGRTPSDAGKVPLLQIPNFLRKRHEVNGKRTRPRWISAQCSLDGYWGTVDSRQLSQVLSGSKRTLR